MVTVLFQLMLSKLHPKFSELNNMSAQAKLTGLPMDNSATFLQNDIEFVSEKLEQVSLWYRIKPHVDMYVRSFAQKIYLTVCVLSTCSFLSS